MIDWLKLRLPVEAHGKIPGDVVMIVSPDGELKWSKTRAVEITGSYESNIHVSSCPVSGLLVIDGNPNKFFQGHNVFGSGDIHALVGAIIDHVLPLSQIEVNDQKRQSMRDGVVEIARVDLTEMFSLGTLGNARAAVRAMGERATMRHRGRGTLTREGTAYWGKHSRRSAIKAYAKGDELRDHKLPKGLPFSDEIAVWAADKLRIEVVLRGMELKERGLALLVNWKQDTAASVFTEFLGKLNVPDNIEMTPAAIESLSPRLRLAYDSWMRGTDLRARLPRRTFYRYRAELLAHGVDILTLRPAEAKSNVLPLIRILEARPAGIPEWAAGTPILFGPKRAA